MAALESRGGEVIAALLAYLREGFEIHGFLKGDARIHYQWGWRLTNAKGEIAFVPLPDSWVKPQ